VAFFLVAGSYSAVTSMKKRDNPGLEVVECPSDVLSRPDDEHQTARIVCTSEDVPDCFRVQHGGVEGTVVQMPDECGGPSFARAVSLTLSANQTLPGHLQKRRITSPVFDFTFDYNIALVRRDAGDFRIRMDFSNVPGYWNAVVQSPGEGNGGSKRDIKELVDRFYGSSDGWYSKFESLRFRPTYGIKDTVRLRELLYHDGQICGYDDETSFGESLSIAMEGTSTMESHFGYSLIANWKPGGGIEIHHSAGFLRPEGETDVTFTMGGSGVLDTSEGLQGPEIRKKFQDKVLYGKEIYKGWAAFNIYRETSAHIQSTSGGVAVSGYMQARAKSDWGHFPVNFPAGAVGAPDPGAAEGQRLYDRVSKAPDNELEAVGEEASGAIEVGATIRVGLHVEITPVPPWQSDGGFPLPEMSLAQTVYARWLIDNGADQSCLTTSLGTTMESSHTRGEYSGWKDQETRKYVQELSRAGDRECFAAGPESSALARREAKLSARQQPDPDDLRTLPNAGLNLRNNQWRYTPPLMRCDGCGNCVLDTRLRPPCCGCVYLPDIYGPTENTRDDEMPSGPLVIDLGPAKRGLPENMTDLIIARQASRRPGQKPKEPIVCGIKVKSHPYSSYPNRSHPNSAGIDFDGDDDTQGYLKYFHNATGSCTDWTVRKFPAAGRIWNPKLLYPPGGYREQPYHSMSRI
jgi:hypothetical protein